MKEALLASAAENAKKKAEILCAASGARLGRLMNIDYNWGEIGFRSRTRYGFAQDEAVAAKSAAFNAAFVPDDITSSDSAAFTRELAD